MFERYFRNNGSGDGDPIQRRGLARVLEIILDNLTRLLVSSLLCLVCLIPWAAAVLWAVSRGGALELVGAGFAGGMLFGPAYGPMARATGSSTRCAMCRVTGGARTAARGSGTGRAT